MRGLEKNVGRALPDLGVGTAHDTGDTDNARTFSLGRIGDEQILRIQLSLLLVQGHEALARAGAAHDDGRRERSQVVGVHRLAEVEHDVVRDVDGQRQGTHAGGLEALNHPTRGRSGRVGAAHDARDEAVDTRAAADRRVVGEDHGEALGVGRGGLGGHDAGQARVAEGGAGRVGVLARDAAHREAVAAVRGHVDLQDLFAQAQPGDDVGADRGNLTVREVLRQHDDAVVILTQTKLARGADHAVGDVTVGLAGGDLEVAGQDGAGQGDHDQVVDVEVMRAADNAAAGQLRGLLAGAGSIVVLTHVHAAVVDDLAVRGRLFHAGQDAAHDEWAGYARRVDLFFLKTDLHQGGGQCAGVGAFGDVHVVGQPAQRNHRHVSFPFH